MKQADMKSFNAMGGYDMDDDDEMVRQNDDEDDDTAHPYLINRNKNMMQVWESIINSLTIYSMLCTPFILVFK